MSNGSTAAKVSSQWQCATGIVVVVVGALVAAWVAMSRAIDSTGGPPEHNTGQSFANLAGLLVTSATVVALGLTGFTVAWHSQRSQRALNSTVVGLAPGVLAIAIVPWIWTT